MAIFHRCAEYIGKLFVVLSSLYVCMVNIKLKYNFVETQRKFIIAKLSIRDEDPSLRIEGSAIINLRGVSPNHI